MRNKIDKLLARLFEKDSEDSNLGMKGETLQMILQKCKGS